MPCFSAFEILVGVLDGSNRHSSLRLEAAATDMDEATARRLDREEGVVALASPVRPRRTRRPTAPFRVMLAP